MKKLIPVFGELRSDWEAEQRWLKMYDDALSQHEMYEPEKTVLMQLSDAFCQASLDGALALMRLDVDAGRAYRNSSQQGVFHVFMQAGHVEGVRFCLEHRFSVTDRDNKERLPLHCCSSRPVLETYFDFLESCSDAAYGQLLMESFYTHLSQPSFFVRACLEGKHEIVDFLWRVGVTCSFDSDKFFRDADETHGLRFYAMYHDVALLQGIFSECRQVCLSGKDTWVFLIEKATEGVISFQRAVELLDSPDAYTAICLPEWVSEEMRACFERYYNGFIQTVSDRADVFDALNQFLEGRASPALLSVLKGSACAYPTAVYFWYGNGLGSVPAFVPPDDALRLTPDLRLECFLLVKQWLLTLGVQDLKLVFGYSSEAAQLLRQAVLIAEGPSLFFALHGLLSHALLDGAFLASDIGQEALTQAALSPKAWFSFLSCPLSPGSETLIWDKSHDLYARNFQSPFWLTAQLVSGRWDQTAPYVTRMVQLLYNDALWVAYEKPWSETSFWKRDGMTGFVAYGAMHTNTVSRDPVCKRGADLREYPGDVGVYDITPEGFIKA